MDILNSIINSVNDILWSYVVIAVLILAGLWFTWKTDFVQIRHLGEMFRLLGEGAMQKPQGKGHITTFQAFCVSTASRVGVGNIAGIAIACVVGGPGAIFWMWVIAIIGSASGFVESTLAQIYKERNPRGGFYGGPAFYIRKGLGNRFFATLFAILLTITFALIYNSVQANTISLALSGAFGWNRVVIGLSVALASAIIIFGGLSRIAKFAGFLVPPMAIGYILIALAVCITNFDRIPGVFASIFGSAFGWDSAYGAGLGVAMMTGIKRGLFSNEAGEGSVPNAAAAADASHPVKQGLIQAFGVFVDTLFVCTASAMIVLLCPDWSAAGKTGIELVQHSLTQQFGSWASFLVTGMIFIFAFSSLIGNTFYGEVNLAYLRVKPTGRVIFRICVVGMIIFGSIAELNLVWNLADLFMALLTLVNITAIVLLGRYAFIALSDYLNQKARGIADPDFDPNCLPSRNGIECWPRTREDVKEQTLS